MEWPIFGHYPAGNQAGEKMFNPTAPRETGFSPETQITLKAPTFLSHGIDGGMEPTSYGWRSLNELYLVQRRVHVLPLHLVEPLSTFGDIERIAQAGAPLP